VSEIDVKWRGSHPISRAIDCKAEFDVRLRATDATIPLSHKTAPTIQCTAHRWLHVHDLIGSENDPGLQQTREDAKCSHQPVFVWCILS
jgi:hypothetical protein